AFALFQRQRREILAVLREQIECEEREPAARCVELLEQLEAGNTSFVEDDHLAVDHCAPCSEGTCRGDDLREVLRVILSTARDDVDATAVEKHPHPEAVELEL